jgi:hypothetical protein
MAKRFFSLVFLMSVLVLLTAMGEKGTGFDRVPRVDRNFSVSVTDSTGHTLQGEKFSWEGRIRFSGFIGAAEVNLPFEKIKEVTMGEKKDRKVRVTARLQDGSDAVFDLDANSRCYGEAGFGSFMLPVSDIRSVSFKGVK